MILQAQEIWGIPRIIHLKFILGNLQDGTRTRSSFKQVQQEDHMAVISQIELKDIYEALKHESWINAM